MTLYQKIENQIMIWGNDGTKTAGSLTRKIMKLIEEENKKEIRDIKIDLVLEADTTCDEIPDQMNKKYKCNGTS